MIKWMKEHTLVSLLLCVFLVVVIAGAVMYGLFGGYNNSLDAPAEKTFEVHFVESGDLEEQLQTLCEDEFGKQGLSFTKKEVLLEVDTSTLVSGYDKVLTYTFAESTSSETLQKAADAVNEAVRGQDDLLAADSFASMHVLESKRFYEPAWRGAIALAVAAVVALAYVCIRYGMSCGIAGFAVCVHDMLFTAAIFAVTRFPVYAMAPVLYAGAAGFMSALLWVFLCNRLRPALKEGEGRTSEEIIREVVKDSKKAVIFAAIPFAAAIAVLGIAAFGGATFLILPMLVSVLVPVYSVLFLAPEIAIPIRAAFDRRREKASAKKKYVGKKKAQETEE